MSDLCVVDPRTEQVLRAADNVDHIFCDTCSPLGTWVMCGEPDPGDECPCDGRCTPCPMCELEWERHECGDLAA